MRFSTPPLMEAVAAEALRSSLRHWSAQAFVTLCWACVECGQRPLELLHATTVELGRRPHAFNDVDLATLVKVLAASQDRMKEETRRVALTTIARETSVRALPHTKHALLRIHGALHGHDSESFLRRA